MSFIGTFCAIKAAKATDHKNPSGGFYTENDNLVEGIALVFAICFVIYALLSS